MRDQALFDKIDLHLIRVLHTVLTERSVSKAAIRMVEPAADILRSAEALFSDARGFDPRTSTRSFRVAASDYLDPLFLPRLVARIKAEAPLCPIEILPLSPDAHYHAQLADGGADLVIGNWPEPPGDLHLGKLFADEVVCLVSREHPAVRRGWSLDDWLQAEHIAPTPTHLYVYLILAPPLAFPPLGYYQLWHARTQHSAAAAWLRECVRKVADSLPKG